MALPPLFADLPPALRPFYDEAAPWQLLEGPLAAALAALPSERIEIGLSPDFHLLGDRIAIGAGTRIHPTAVLEGPIFVGAGVTIGPGAYLRGGCWIGAGALVGAHCEVKRSILLPGAEVAHLSYVGDSILGAAASLGAGTILSNYRHDGGEIQVEIDGRAVATNRRKLGALLGDGVRAGCNCVLGPGCIVGAGTAIYPGALLRSAAYPAGHLVKVRQQLEIVERTRLSPGDT
ncbi:MAG: UDP-N-acetylglucosamine diphosphorylase [Acidobacteriota bacterium]|nr:UDP-N-acetylglucosamine diphosphorylase [Acidobacteriota bacterium]MDH3522606.1 UDP-N-acetylglucosamine diphosphorylase [Acidobacteriota bacterium]